ncbi:MAG: iron ABC transporter permease [Cyanobacteria bacterium SIG29]|nr:iron ABC transporter permease [Cyanobacteria bacterium SIG29]
MTKSKKITIIIILAIILLISLYLAMYAGYKDFGCNMLYKAFNLSEDTDSMILTVLRYPRALKALIAGCCLALAGMFMQSVSKNPLAEPYITGISAGAGLGIVLSILLFNSSNYSIFGFIGALISSALVIIFSGLSRFSITKLILIGLSMNIFVSSLISLIILVNPLKSYMMMLILSGGVTNNEIISNKMLVIVFCLLMLASAIFIPKLNYLRLDSELLETNKNRKYLYTVIVIIIASFLTSLSVFAAGILGFVGIIAPQISRMLLGQDYRWLFIANTLIGGSLILLADFAARTVIYPLQVPLGLVVAFIGAPIFVYFLTRKGDMFRD